MTQTYARIRDRCAQINKQRAESGGDSGEVEQIQLQAVEPGTSISIVVPQPNSEDEVERKAREIFDGFPESLQKALESSSLDEVNKVLASMSVAEAEGVVAQLGEVSSTLLVFNRIQVDWRRFVLMCRRVAC